MERKQVNPAPKKSTRRIVYIDILRTIAILAVIMLHCISDHFVSTSLYGSPAWHAVNVLNTLTRMGVPIFFMISGYLLISDTRETTLRKYFSRRLPKILIPFIIWNVIYFIYNAKMYGGVLDPIDFIYRFVTMDISYHFWFVYTLLCLYLIVPVIKPFFNRATNTQLLYVLIISTFPTTIGPIFNKFSGVWLFRFEPLFLGYFGFIVLGYMLGRMTLSRRARLLIYLAGIIGACASIFGTIYLSSPDSIDTFFNSGYGISPYCVGAAMFVLVRQIGEKVTSVRVHKMFSTFGKLSFGVYLSHVIVMDILHRFTDFSHISTAVIFYFIATSVICFVLAFVISKIKILRDILI